MSELVQVAFAFNSTEGGLIQGLLESGGIESILQPTGVEGPSIGQTLPAPGPQRVMVRAEEAEAAAQLLAETLVAEDPEAEPDIANARHLEDAAGKGPRNYGIIGAFARIWLWGLGAMAVAFGVFLALHG